MTELMSIPRTRGGDPTTGRYTLAAASLFPAHAGVIQPTATADDMFNPIPRTRGGDPGFVAEDKVLRDYSPHTRG